MVPGRSGGSGTEATSRPIVTTNRMAGALLVAVALGLAVATSFTTPFTVPADEVVGAGFVVLGAILVVQWRWSKAPPVLARQPMTGPDGRSRRWGWRWAVWLAPVAAVVAFELFNYTQLPRHAHPTLSSLLDSLTASHPGHAVAFAGWLAFGWFLARR